MAKANNRLLTCFIIMPFSEVKFADDCGKVQILPKHQLDDIYRSFFKKVILAYHKRNTRFGPVNRYEEHRGNFIRGIVKKLHECDLVLADLTGLNPNVCYELGVRHTLKAGTIIVTQDTTTIPSDLRSYLAVPYRYEMDPAKNNQANIPTFTRALHRTIDEFLQNKDDPDNPVLEFFEKKTMFIDSILRRNLEGNRRMLGVMKDIYEDNMDAIIKQLLNWQNGVFADVYYISICIQPFLQRMVNLNESSEVIRFLHDLLVNVQINQNNMELVRKMLLASRAVGDARKVDFGFCDRHGENHSIFELMEHYELGSDGKHHPNDSEPVANSFSYFVQEWEEELKRLPS